MANGTTVNAWTAVLRCTAHPLSPVSLTGDVSRLTVKTGVVESTIAAIVSSYDDPVTSFPLTFRRTSPTCSAVCLIVVWWDVMQFVARA